MKGLKSWKSLGKKNQENLKIVFVNSFNKLIFYLFLLVVNIQHYKILLRINLTCPVGPVLIFISSSYKLNSTTAMKFEKTNNVSCTLLLPHLMCSVILARWLDASLRLVVEIDLNTSCLWRREKKIKSHMMDGTAAPGGNLTSVLCDKLSQIGINFSKSKDLVNSSISIEVNALMMMQHI